VSIENARLYESLVESNRDLLTANQRLQENFRQTIVGFAHAIEENDRYTRGHSDRVAQYVRLLAEGLSLPPREVETAVQAALLHDIGKIGIRPDKLNKPGQLTADEMALFRTHPLKGKRILEPIPFMADLIPVVLCHHENFDGSGYPLGLAGQEIPLLARIAAIADAYDAMTSDRAYRRSLPHEVTCRELERCAGTRFDPEMVPVFVARIEELRQSGGLPEADHEVPPLLEEQAAS
jgi:HD-GYP domain-containing protein (c-di-GMP phosphodiesterase class II)